MRSMVKTVWKSDKNRPRYEQIPSKMFDMLNFAMQAIRKSNRKSIASRYYLMS